MRPVGSMRVEPAGRYRIVTSESPPRLDDRRKPWQDVGQKKKPERKDDVMTELAVPGLGMNSDEKMNAASKWSQTAYDDSTHPLLSAMTAIDGSFRVTMLGWTKDKSFQPVTVYVSQAMMEHMVFTMQSALSEREMVCQKCRGPKLNESHQCPVVEPLYCETCGVNMIGRPLHQCSG